MCETKEWHVRTFHQAYKLVISIVLLALVVGCNWYKGFQSFFRYKVFKRYANIKFIVECYSIKCSFQFFNRYLIIDKSFLWNEVEILLQCLIHHFTWHRFKTFVVVKLGLNHCSKSVTNSNNRKVHRFITIVVLCPNKDIRYLVLVFLIQI